jgi:uncharacterized protein (TIGR03435 family)
MRASSLSILTAALAYSALCQEFEVVSVKPNKSTSYDSGITTNRGRLMATNASLRRLIVSAYGVQDYQVEGPEWLGSERFDVSATIPEALPKGEKYDAALQVMMQKMLSGRFKLVVHREQKTRPVYGLMTGKSGVKFKEAPASDCDSHSRNNSGTHFVGTCVSMDGFAQFLARRRRDLPLDLPVLDMTGLQGFYNLKLDWVPESKGSSERKDDVPGVGASASGVTLLVALEEQLGLKLETRKAPIDILVVDDAQKAPSEN